MADSYQNEIPKARVNITLDLDTQGAQEKKELPMKLLAMGDFSQGQSTDPIADRKRVGITKINFNEVMSSFSPTVDIEVDNKIDPSKEPISCHLKFDEIKDFSPDKIVESVPELNKLLAMRHLLKDLKANIVDNHTFRKKLEAIFKDQDKSQSLVDELNRLSSLEQ